MTTPEVAEKIQRTAAQMEKSALARVSDVGPTLGKLLDTFA